MARRDDSTEWGMLCLALGFALGVTIPASAQDRDGDGLGDLIERPFGDTDQDQLADELDNDDDGDGLGTADELGLDANQPRDSDADGLPDYRDYDDDNDGVSTADERSVDPAADGNTNGTVAYLDKLEVGPYTPDADRDGLLDSMDVDDDNDGVPDLAEQIADSDGDGKVDRIDADDDGDGVPTYSEQPNPAPGRDTDADGKPDYLDADDDGDGLPTRSEESDPNHDGMVNDARVTSGNTPDYLNADDDGDEIPTRDERPGSASRDSDDDRIFDHLDRDDDGDTRDTAYEKLVDTDRDGTVDYLDTDDDGDGLLTRVECANATLLDFDGDGLLNYLDLDSDGDTLSDAVEGDGDRNGNGAPDYLDAPVIPNDADNDGVANSKECPTPSASCPDTDLDGKVDSEDPDDDGDGLSTRDESGQTARDTDRDDVADYLDSDDDGDGLLTKNELNQGTTRDTDHDGKPDQLDSDDDGDGIATRDEGAPDRDTDRDGIADYLDSENEIASDAALTTPEAGARDAGSSGVPVVTTVHEDDGGCSVSVGAARRPPLFLFASLLLLTMLRRRGCRVLLGLSSAAFAGPSCGDDADPPTVAIGDASLDGGGRLDGRVELDASDAAAADARADGSFSSECNGDLLRFASIRGEGRSFGAAIDGNRSHLAFLVPACGDITNPEGARNIRYVTFPTAGDAGGAVDLLPEGCTTPRDPTLVSDSAGLVSLFYGAWDSETFELFARTPASSGSAQVQTSSSGRELFSVASTLGTGESATLAYALQNPSSAGAPTSIETLQVGRAAVEILPVSAGQRALQLGLAALGASTGMLRGVVAWVSDSASAAGVFARLVDLRGSAQGELLTLSRAAGAQSTLAVASRKSGAGLVYTELLGGEGYEIRFRELSASGAIGEPVVLTGGNERVGEIAIAAHRNGYAVAYRRLASSLNPEPSLRLLFIDAEGHLGGSRFVSQAAANGSSLVLLSALDGRLVLLWDDVAPVFDAGGATTGLTLQAARLTCN